MIRRVFLIAAAAALLATPLLGESWPSFHRTPDRAGMSNETLTAPLTVAWQFQTDGAVDFNGGISSSPAVVEGSVYFGCQDGNVYALDAQTGAVKWKYLTGGWIGSSPAVDKGVVFIASSDGFLYALKADTGAVKWTYETGGSDVSSPAVSGGMVVCGSGYPNKFVYAVNEETGALVWKQETGQMIYSTPAISGNRVVMGSDDAYYRCYDLATGAVQWQFATTGGIYRAAPAITGNTVYFAPGDWDRQVYAANLTTGVKLWAFMVPQTYWQTNSYVSTPATAGGVVYIVAGCPTEKLFALNGTTGAKLWEFNLGDTSSSAFASSPLVSGDTVYVATSTGYVYGIDKTSGAQVWSYNLQASVLSSLALSGGWLYVGDESGRLTAFTRPAQTITSPANFVQVGWNLVSVPAVPANPDPLVVFSPEDVPNASFQFWKNNVDGGGYQIYGDVFGWKGPVAVGTPYWFLEKATTMTLSFSGYPVIDDWYAHIPAHANAPYWIMFGQPFSHSTPCTSLEFSSPITSPTPVPWTTAYNLGLVESGAAGFEGAHSNFFTAGPPDYMVERNYTEPWYGYWLMVRTTEPLTIRFPYAAR